ncbi:MAG: 60 kDa chaperonin [Verrucomicrobiota bacterium]
MTAKRVFFGAAAREHVLRGAAALAEAVRVTLGPRSKCVLIGRRWGRPVVCNDGVTIAKEFELEDATANLGVQVLRQAAEQTAEAVGDGTTTATVLAHAMFSDGIRNVTAGASAVDLKRGMDRGMRAALRALKASSRKLESRRERAQVASLSAHNDNAMGDLVAEAMEKVGTEGAITVEESRGTETSLELVEGMQIAQGYLSPYFVTDTSKMEAVLESPLILLTSGKISRLGDLLPLLEQLAKGGRPLLVVAEDVEGEALATLVVNKLRGVLGSVAVKAPGFGESRKALMEDLAVLSGGSVVSEERGISLEKVRLEDLGSARRVVVKRDSTTLIGGGGTTETIHARCAQLRQQQAETTSEYEREKLGERLAKLTGGVAVIRVGAPSEAEMQNRKEAFADAISATKAAVAEGIVAGGGLALLQSARAVDAELAACEGDERTGVLILRRALEAPARQIAQNSCVDGGVVVERMLAGTGNVGFDAATGRYVDLFEAGILDPAKVVRVALENAVSVAGVLLFTEATLNEIPEERPAHAPGQEGTLGEA